MDRGHDQTLRRVMDQTTDAAARARPDCPPTRFADMLATALGFARLVTGAEDPQTLARKACRVLTDLMGYDGVWIASLPAETDGTPTTADFRDADVIGCGVGRDLVGERFACRECSSDLARVLACDTTAVIPGHDRPAGDDQEPPTCSHRLAWARRIQFENRLFGLMLVFVPDQRIHDAAERKVFDELVDVLAFGLFEIEAARRVKESDEWAALIAETARDAVVMIDPDGAVRFWNAAAEQLFGYARSEVEGRNLHELIAPQKYRDKYRRAFEEFRNTGRGGVVGRTIELQGRRKNGREVTVELSLSALRRRGAWHAVGVMRDVSERKRAEEALLRAEEKWRHVLVKTPQVGVGQDHRARIVFANAHFLQLTGWREEEILGRDWFDLFIPEEVREEVRGVFGQAMESPQSQSYTSYENEILTRGGERRNIAWSNVATLNLVGETVEVICLGIDISERKRMEDALRAREQHLQAVLQTTIDGYWVVDQAGRIVEVNEAFCRLIGHEREQALAMSVFDLDSDGTPESFAERSRRIEAQGSERFEARLRHAGGHAVPVEISATYAGSGGGRIICFGRDLTQRKRAEEKLAAQSELQRLLVEISSDCINLPHSATGGVIHDSLGRIARFVDADRAYVFDYDHDRRTMSNTLEWCREGIAPQIDDLQDVPMDLELEWVALHRQGMPCFCDDVQNLPVGHQRAFLENQNIRSLVTVPVLQGGICTGFVGFDYVRGPHRFGPHELDLLSVFAGILANLRARKQAEDEIAVLAGIVDVAPSSITVHDEQGRFLYANRRTLEMHGYDRETFLALNLSELDTPESAAELADRFGRIRAQGEAVFQVVHLRRDGRVFPLEVLAKTIDWYGRQAVLSIATDITDRRKAERVLRQFKTIFDRANFGMVICDLEGRFTYVNDRFAADHGHAAAELIGGPIAMIHTPAQMAVVERTLDLLRSEGSFGPFEVGHRHRDGSEFPMLMTGVLIEDEDGRPLCMAATALDLTERKELEGRLLQAQKMESVGRLAGGVAHDFNNMLNVILGHADLMLEDLPADSPHRRGVQEVQSAARRSADLTRQLLAFARKQTIAPKTLDLNDTVASLLKMLGRLIGENVHLVWRPADLDDPIRIDPAQIDQVLANLVVNARDAIGQEAGTITIATGVASFDEAWCARHEGYAPGRYVRLTVGDDGCGMDEATLANIFEPFYTTKATGEGTGLGLATVYGIVTQNRGFLQVVSEPGRGSTFDIYLPVHQAGSLSDRDEQGPQRLPDLGGHETVLLVEDEPAILDLTRLMLERFGYRVLAAGSPDEACRLAADQAGAIDLVVTDVVMPQMNGSDLVDLLERSQPGLRVLYMSGHASDVLADRPPSQRERTFLAKPFSLEQLGLAVRRALGR